METRPNPCTACGACCACYIVYVPATEVTGRGENGNGVPSDLVTPCDRLRSAMKGTRGFRKRCAALEGIVGQRVSCRIYGSRPSTCRNFLAAWEGTRGNENCNRARLRYGLQPFSDY